MIDLRGHGQSSPARMSFGLKEHRDILGAVDWLKGRGYRPGHIGVLGQSMGGASTLYAVAAEPGDRRRSDGLCMPATSGR